ncbi:MAG: hypothetical protein PHI63_06460, partial [Patescibacteria group bacterium]|nr:hypothetical protein [Patescibacteria group bacterium]
RSLIVLDPVQQRPENRLGRFLAARDRGKNIRTESDELALIAQHFTVQRVVKTNVLSVDGMAVLAGPK